MKVLSNSVQPFQVLAGTYIQTDQKTDRQQLKIKIFGIFTVCKEEKDAHIRIGSEKDIEGLRNMK